MKRFFLLCAIAGLNLMLAAQPKIIIRFNQPDSYLVKRFFTQNYDIAAYSPGQFLDLVVSEEEYKSLLNEGLNPVIYQTEEEIKAILGAQTDIPGYRKYSQLLSELQQIEAAHPDICKVYDIGNSNGKNYYLLGKQNYVNYQHDIWALKLSDNVLLEEDEPAIYFMGAHHAREPLSTEVTMYILNYLVNNYGTNPSVTNMVNSKEIWFIPIVNPDGHKIVLDQIDVNWRKNIRDNDNNNQITFSGGWSYPDGVDLNRNYGWQFGGEGASANPGDQTYRGPSAFSEPEVAAVRDLIASRHFVAGISYHTYSELVLWPYGYTSGAVAPDATALSALGTAMANTIPKIGGGGFYTPQPSWQLYPAAGVTDDWVYGQYGIFGYTIELATQFIPPQAQVTQICQDNLQAALLLINRVNTSTLTGIITNAVTGQPVVAEIFVQGIDNTGLYREPYKSRLPFGRYYRMLPNGNYTVTFSAWGYISQTIQNVNINPLGQTILDIALVPSQVLSVSGTVTNINTGQPIVGASVEVVGTPLPVVYTNAQGQYLIPEIFENTYSFKIWAQNYATLIQQVTVNPQNTVFNFQLTPSNAISFEGGVFPPGFTFAGNANWTITSGTAWDGQYSAKSGSIGNNQTSQMIFSMEVATAGTISFYYKVSSEANYDYLKFYINNQLKGQWSGEVGWTEAVYQVNPGMNTFRWSYEKDVFVVAGQDCAWVDYIVLPPAATVTANAGPDAQICQGATHQCQGNAAYYTSLLWTTSGDGQFSNPAVLSPVYTPGNNDISSGSVTLTLTAYGNNNTSSSDQMVLTINPLPAQGSPITGNQSTCAGYSENYTCEIIPHAILYEWVILPSSAGVITSQNFNQITINWSQNFNGEAQIKVRGVNDCGFGQFSEALVVNVFDCTSIFTLESTSSPLIYPNPAYNYTLIHLPVQTTQPVEISLFTAQGKLVYYSRVDNSNDRGYYLSLETVPGGVYLMHIRTDAAEYFRKLIIFRK